MVMTYTIDPYQYKYNSIFYLPYKHVPKNSLIKTYFLYFITGNNRGDDETDRQSVSTLL